MKQNKTVVRILSAVLVVAMLICTMSINAFAALPVPDEMIVISDKETTLAPGITQNETVIYDKNNRRVELFVATADLNVSTVGIQSSYVGAQCINHGMAKMTEQVAAHQAKYEARGEQYTAVVGMNGSYYNMTTGQPEGAFYMEGVNGNGTNANGKPFFAILKDGTPYIGRAGDYEIMKDQIWESVGANEVLVWEGKNLYPSTDTTKYPRSVVGLTADNKVIFLNANGNQTKSAGLTRYEAAQLLIEKGCVAAVKYDEGGSATYVTKPQGSDSYVVTNTPSDGSERPVSTGLIIYSTAKGSGMFDSAVLTAENDYVTPYSEVTISAVGADDVGGAAEVPADAEWYVDEKYGTVEDGIFKSNGTVGEVKVQLIYNEEVVGETTVNVVIPEIAFANESTVVPYGKTIPLNVTATYNMIPVTLKEGDVTYSLSDAALGTIENGEFTACSASSGLTGGTLIATLNYGENIVATTTLVFGKGSEVLMDFENSKDEDFVMRSFYYDRNGASGATGPAGRQEMGEAWVVDATTGKVRNGNKALAVNVDNSWGTAAGGYSIMLHFPSVDCTGATYIGMWMYIPVKEMSKISVDVYAKSTITAPTATNAGGTLFSYQGFKNASVTPGEDGWYYFRLAVSGVNQISALRFSTTDSNNTIWNPYDDLVFYIDDITADFSDAVEDRENPVFSNVYISETADSKVVMNGQTITQNKITVVASAADNTTMINYTGLNVKSAKAYVDGKEITQGVTCADNGTVMVDNITLSNGTHTFRFEISDNAGNMGAIERQVVVNTANGNVYLEAPNTALVPLGSVQYFKLMAKNIEDVKSVTTVIDLDSISHWELKGMEVPHGFTAEYSINEDFNTATITITRTGDIEVSGETALAILPVRTWEPLGWKTQHFIDLGVVSANPGLVDSYKMMTPYGMWNSDGTRMYRIEMQIDAGEVTYLDGTTDTFASDEKHILTEMNRYRADGHYDANWNWVKENPATSVKEVRQDKLSNHIHIAGTAQDKAATCTTAGYTGRIFCVGCDCGSKENIYNATVDSNCKGHEGGCGSVIDWGTIIPATGHNYAVVDGVLKCECGKVFNGVYTDGKTYIDGVVVANGWNADSTKYYIDGVAVTGVKFVDGFYREFAADGTYIDKYTGKHFSPSRNGYVYLISGLLKTGWIAIDDAWYYFNPSTCVMTTGTYTIEEGASAGITYQFAEDGNLTDGVWHTTADGKIQYFYGPDCYKWSNNTLEVIDGKTYCFDKNGYLYLGNQVLQVGYNQPTWFYEFDEVTGELIAIHKDKTGFVSTYEGAIYYLVEGVPQKGLGMITIDGAQYYVRGNGHLAVGNFYIDSGYKGCGHLKSGYYDFGTDGKFNAFTGVKADEDGNLHYYVNDVIQSGLGMITIEGDKYYVRGNGLLAVGKYYIGEGYVGCEDLAPGYYVFGEDGKFVGPYTTFTGVKADEDGNLHYYVNDVIQSGLGMITIEGDNYYVRGNGLLAVGKYYIGASYKGCEHLTEGYYDFGTDGKFIGPSATFTGVKADEDGNLHYYVNDVIQSGLGMITVDGAQYYVRGNGLLAIGNFYIDSGYKGCGHLKSGYYDFGTDGKFNAFTGVKADEEGNLHYYVNNVIQSSLGMITIDGARYYVRGNGLLAVGKYYIGEGYVGCEDLAPGYYVFGEDGKFVGPYTTFTGVKADEDGNLHYYVNDVIQSGLGMITIEGDNYYVRGNGLLAVGKFYIGASYKGCEHLTEGYYDFGTDGKFIGPSATFTGVKADEDGNLHYYVNDVIQSGLGMITIEGDNYYVRGNGLLAVGKYYIGASYKGCEHLTEGYYDFGTDGKFIGPSATFTGVKADEDGNLHYYVNDVIQKGLGMITIDGARYYVRGNGLLAVGNFYIGAGYKGCEGITPGYYDFGEDGKFTAFTGVKADEDGNLHYYVNDVIQSGLGMITIEGDKYYVRGNGLLAVGKYYIGEGYVGCEDLTPGYYEFSEDGKFVGPYTTFTGIKADEDGNLHYYVNDVIQRGLGMITIEGYKYYVRGNGLLAVGKYYVGAGYIGCDHLTPGYYDFGTDGKFVGPWEE